MDVLHEKGKNRKWDSPLRRIALIVGILGGGGYTTMQIVYKAACKVTAWTTTMMLSGTFETVMAHASDQTRQDAEVDQKINKAVNHMADAFWDKAIERGIVNQPHRRRRKTVMVDDDE